MKENVLKYITELESYKTAIKQLHWSAKNMSEHKLFDDIASSVANVQDEVSEMEQGMHGQVQPNILKPSNYEITSSKKFLDDLMASTKEFYGTIDGEEYVGIRSVVESFMGEVDKFKYLLDICLKEDLQRRLNKKQVNEAYNGVNDEWYEEEDYNGHIGEPGMIRSYDIGTYYDGQAEEDAAENGYDNVEEYLRYWWNEVQPECPWYWTKVGSGYGYNGTTIFRDGQTVCKNIYGQIMFDEYPIGGVRESRKIRKEALDHYPKSVKGRENLIYKAVRGARLDSMKYHDESWQALRDYDYIISSLGLDFTYWCENGGYCDYDPTDHMARSKEYKIKITFPDGFAFGGYIKMMAAGTVEDPFSAYDTCIVLWPNREDTMESKVYTLTNEQLNGIIKESVIRLLKEYGDTEKGQYDLGRLCSRKAKQHGGYSSKESEEVQDYAIKQRKGDADKHLAFDLGARDEMHKGSTTDSEDKTAGEYWHDRMKKVKGKIGKHLMKPKHLSEGRNNDHYTHFAVNKETNKIVNGWDYSDIEPTELKQFKRDYFIVDLVDYGLDPKNYKIVGDKFLRRNGIDPDDDSNWANR